MRAPYTQLYLHLVWATWDRLPLLGEEEVLSRVYRCIREECLGLKCEPLAIGGIADHVHLLVRLPTTTSVANLVKQVKGSSAHLVSQEIRQGDFFKWQGGYGAFTLRRSDVPTVTRYILEQKQHHTRGDLWDDWEMTQEPDA